MLGLWQSNVVYSNSVSNFSPRVPRFAQLMELIVQLWLTWLAMFLALLQTLTILTFEIWLAIFGVWSSRVSCVQDSAVLILNAEDGIGRNAALMYSELGYTVFALCPDHQSGASDSARGSSVSSILYSWHLKKERSPDHPWGLIAPIMVDISSNADRLRAYETVKAYCSDHSLHLTALIAFPPTYENPPEITSPHSADSFPQDNIPFRFLPLSIAKPDVWQDSVFREITEPVLIIQQYTQMLKKSSGHIIVVSGCSRGRFSSESGFSSTLDDARRSIAHTFVLDAWKYPKHNEYWMSCMSFSRCVFDMLMNAIRNVCTKKFDPDILNTLASIRRPGALQNMLRPFVAREEDLLAVLQKIIDSRHPKVDYYVGSYPFLHWALDALPLTVFGMVQRWLCWLGI